MKAGSDHEIGPETIILQGEENHHRKQRGWTYRFGVWRCATQLEWEYPDITKNKIEMKAAGFHIVGSGQVAGLLRLAQFRLGPKFKKIMRIIDGCDDNGGN